MAEPSLVADCIKAMQDAVAIPVTVKHRIGVDRRDDYGFVRDFVGALHGAGCHVFIVHARSAWLKGLSPKENREVPPLDYSRVLRLKQDFPSAEFVLNGGISSLSAAREHLGAVDGVMLGRAAYHDPYLLADADRALFGDASPATTRDCRVEDDPLSAAANAHRRRAASHRAAHAWAVSRLARRAAMAPDIK